MAHILSSSSVLITMRRVVSTTGRHLAAALPRQSMAIIEFLEPWKRT